jgi:hypothetical protein
MISIVGIVIIAASGAALWRMLPTNAKVHRLATMPFVESVIPIGIVAGFAIGAALVFAGITVR